MLVIAFSACTKVGTSEQTAGGRHPWTQPGILRFAENADPKTLNVPLGTSAVTGDIASFLFSYAVRYDEHAHPVPDALIEIPTVQNGDVSRDGLTLKYKLRHNIKWHDGRPLRCDDLKFTWQVVMNPHNLVNTTDGYKDIRDIDCSDPFVAVVHMKKLYAPYLQQLWGVNGNAPILPRHVLETYNDAKGSFNTAPYNSAPIGSGPFKFVSWQRGVQVVMKAFPDYFLGAPKLKEVVFKVMPDENTMMTQLQTHEIDLLARGSGLNWPRYAQLASDPANGLNALRVDTFLYSHIDFNLRRPLLQDRSLRLALAYGINRQEIISKIVHGSAEPTDTDQSKILSWAFTDDVQHHDYDPQKARSILDADGWKVGPDGIREKNGQRLTFTYSTQTESTAGKAIQELVQREWHDIGVDAVVKNSSTAQFFDNNPATGVLQGGHYDVAGFSWVAAADPDDSPIYSADNFAPHGQNALFWNDARATAAMNDALKTLDLNRRKADYKIVQQELAAQVPTIFLYFVKEPFVYNTDLKGFRPSPVISPFWNPWEYSI
ncbi:MAG: peptide ABC transporter substrate-binding protein [Candidatus Eremiobacteraeota bacterium]|nr:peptide ABC transporter substrate-binding protein [Candidatus Eremiobacteraeota bacterium]